MTAGSGCVAMASHSGGVQPNATGNQTQDPDHPLTCNSWL